MNEQGSKFMSPDQVPPDRRGMAGPAAEARAAYALSKVDLPEESIGVSQKWPIRGADV